MSWALKSREKNSLLASQILNFEFPIDVLLIGGWCCLSQISCETALLPKTVKRKRMLYLGNALLRYILIYNLEVSFNFHLTFLQSNVIKMFTTQKKNCFFPAPGYSLRAPNNSNLFRFPLKVRVIGSRLYLEHGQFKIMKKKTQQKRKKNLEKKF